MSDEEKYLQKYYEENEFKHMEYTDNWFHLGLYRVYKINYKKISMFNKLNRDLFKIWKNKIGRINKFYE